MATDEGGGTSDIGPPVSRDRSRATGYAVLIILAVSLGVLAAVVYADPAVIPDRDSGTASESGEQPLNTTDAEQAIIDTVNEERLNRGLAPVDYDEGLGDVARNHSQDMVNRDYYAHETPEGEHPWDRVRDSDATCEMVGENIAATWWQTDFEGQDEQVDRHDSVDELATGVTEQWLNSPDHRDNMLHPDWERTGLGVVITDENEVLVTQKFCR